MKQFNLNIKYIRGNNVRTKHITQQQLCAIKTSYIRRTLSEISFKGDFMRKSNCRFNQIIDNGVFNSL